LPDRYATKWDLSAKGRFDRVNCWKCGETLDTRERVGFRDHCPRCDWPLHACLNCEFYDPAYNNQCREAMAERVVDKDRGNFCDFFAPSAKPRASAGAAPKDRLDALFKKKPF
jgi:hypothetical protein